MKRFSLALLCLLLLAPTTPAAAATASLVADLDPRPSNPEGQIHGPLIPLGDSVLFSGAEGSSGLEIWRSDGTSAGTELLRDLCPGSCSSNPELLGVLPGRIAVFLVRDDVYYPGRAELWRTDGTKAGTSRIAASAQDGPDVCFDGMKSRTVGNTIFFNATTPSTGCELWATDGTAAGTRLVKDLSPDSSGSNPQSFVNGAGQLYFTAFSQGQGPGVWRSDGTSAGTVRLASLPLDTRLDQGLLSAVAGSRFFYLVPETGELWVSDGTAAGTKLVIRFEGPDAFLSPNLLKAIDGVVYFVASDGPGGFELWRSDGTAAGTKRITAFPFAQPFESYAFNPSRLVKVGNRLVFAANDSGQGVRLWTSGGTLETTAPLTGCTGGCPVPEASPFVPVGNRIVFSGRTESRGSELWATDGTGAGTRLVSDLCRGRCSSEPHRIVPLLGKAYFLAGIGTGVGLFRTDGTPQGTVLLADLGPNPFDYDEPFDIVAAGGKLFFRAAAGGRQRQLWTSDGTPEGTAPVTLLGGLGIGSHPIFVRAFGSDVLFSACDGEDRSLWRSDGTAAGTLPLPATETDCSGASYPYGLTAVSGIAFFHKSHDGSGRVWRTDGTDAGTYPLPPFGTANVGLPVVFGSRVVFPVHDEDFSISLWESDGSIPGTRKLFDLDVHSLDHLTAIGSRLYFLANGGDDTGDVELWVSDGTLAGTRQLTDTEGYGFDEREDNPLVAVGGLVFFVASDSPYLDLLWKTDGTPQGTGPVLPLSFEPRGRRVQDLGAFAGALYFTALTGDGRWGLWRSNGTEAGTVLVRALGPASGDDLVPARFTVAGGRLFFVADDGEHGVELWATDGTAEGTALVRDVSPGKGSSLPSWLVETGGRLFFSATDGEHGVELWESDGTAAGTRMVQDVMPGGRSSHPEELTVAGNRLFFTADDGIHGREPWVYPLAGAAACQPSDTVLCLGGGRFKVEATWRDFDGRSGPGHAVSLTADTGYFWFFDPANVEVITKVLDGRGVNNHHWVFYGALSTVQYTLTVTDTQTGAARRYVNPPRRLGSVGDTNAFGPLGATGSSLSVGPEAAVFDPVVSAGKAAFAKAPCVPSATRLCLAGGRFAVTARWKDFDGNTGDGQAVALAGGDTGYFWFFGESNVEVVLKVLDGRPVNGKFWVFYGALSSVEYTLTVTDTETGAVKTYRNPAGRLGSVADTGAF